MMGERRRIAISFGGRFFDIICEGCQPHHISPCNCIAYKGTARGDLSSCSDWLIVNCTVN